MMGRLTGLAFAAALVGAAMTAQAAAPEPETELAMSAADLVAHTKMAEAADAMVQLTVVQIVLGVAGTIGLLFTIGLTVRAQKQTEQSLILARTSSAQQIDAMHQQLRAYIGVVVETPTNFHSAKKPRGWITTNNLGQTPAFNLQTSLVVRLRPTEQPHNFSTPPFNAALVLHPGGTVGSQRFAERRLTDEQYGDVLAGRSRLGVIGAVRYRDAFGIDRTTRFATEFWGQDLEHSLLIDQHNDAT